MSTAIQEVCLDALRKKPSMTTRQLTVLARRGLGDRVQNTPHSGPTMVTYAEVEISMRQLERAGYVLRRGTPSEWKLRG
jgi:hypothetical protein